MNRITVGPNAVAYPIAGDAQSQAGSPLVTVTGIQGRPVANPTLQGGETLEYDVAINEWVPTLRACITVDGVVASDDYIITVDVPFPVSVDGVGVN